MRVTSMMEQQQFLYNITNIDTSMQSIQDELSTGTVLNKPSNDPLAVSQDMGLAAQVNQYKGYLSTITSGLTWMNNTSTAVQGIISNLQQVQSVVVQALNTTNSSQGGIAGLADTASQLIQGIYQITDQRQGSDYLFGGQATNVQPSGYLKTSPSDASVAPVPTGAGSTSGTSASQNQRMYEVSSGVSVQINVTASDIFLSSNGGASQNLQDTLNSIQSDLKGDNKTGLKTDLQNLESNLTGVINSNADLGARIQRMNTAQSQLQTYSTNLTNEKGVIEGANMAQVITQFSTDQAIYTAALQMGAKILLPSLVNYLPSGWTRQAAFWKTKYI